MGTDIYRHLGRTKDWDEYYAHLAKVGSAPANEAPNSHSHPVLGITMHAHKGGEEAHTHLPTWTWDMTPVPLDDNA